MEVRAEFSKFYDVEADALVVMIYEGERADEPRRRTRRRAVRAVDVGATGLERPVVAAERLREAPDVRLEPAKVFAFPGMHGMFDDDRHHAATCYELGDA